MLKARRNWWRDLKLPRLRPVIAFFALILLHVAAALFHALIRRDGVFQAMAPVVTYHEVEPSERERHAA